MAVITISATGCPHIWNHRASSHSGNPCIFGHTTLYHHFQGYSALSRKGSSLITSASSLVHDNSIPFCGQICSDSVHYSESMQIEGRPCDHHYFEWHQITSRFCHDCRLSNHGKIVQTESWDASHPKEVLALLFGRQTHSDSVYITLLRFLPQLIGGQSQKIVPRFGAIQNNGDHKGIPQFVAFPNRGKNRSNSARKMEHHV